MPKFIDLTEERFGRLIVIKRVDNDKWSHHRWLCRCVCGEEKIVRGSYLKRGDTKSCGCLRKEITSITHITHGRSKTKTYYSWDNMISRCTNPKNKYYHCYGGRGIIVCKRWLEFENFLEDMGEVPEEYQIDRIDNDGNYCKSNCRWVTRTEQNRNRRDNHLITYKGKTQCIAEWSEETGIPYSTLSSRILQYGWSFEKALTTPVGKYKKRGE